MVFCEATGCATRPTTVAAVFDLAASGQLAWADPDAASTAAAVALRRTEPSIDTADDLLELRPHARRVPGGMRPGNASRAPPATRKRWGMEPVPCAYGDIEPETAPVCSTRRMHRLCSTMSVNLLPRAAQRDGYHDVRAV